MSRAEAVVVVSAIPEELKALARRLTGVRRDRIGGLEVRRGELGDREVVLAVTGEGSRLAAAASERLLTGTGVAALVGVGVAGGLTPDLGAGDLVVGCRVLEAGGGAVEPPEWRWSEPARRLADRRGGTLLTVSRIARTPGRKRELAARFELGSRAAVDLESAAWAHAAMARGLPWQILRAVSDEVDETLPLDFDRFRDADGRLSRRRLVAHALVRPRLLTELDRLRRRVESCAQALAAATEELLAW